MKIFYNFLVFQSVISVAKGLGGAQFHADKTPFALGIQLGEP